LIADATYPYENAKYHFILVYHDHVESLSRVGAEAWQEFKETVDWMVKLKNIPGATLICRFGDTDCTGGSVNHLHASLVSGDPEDNSKPVITRVG